MEKKVISPAAIAKLNEILPKEMQEHYNYQDLSSLIYSLTGEIPQLGYKHEQIPLDQERYRWIKDRVQSIPSVKSVLEIGGNLGYISLRLARELDLKVLCREPIEDYVKVSNFIAHELALNELYKAEAKPVLLDNIDELPKVDLIINLNVIHHAGRVFDSKIVDAMGGWKPYAIEYLAKLAAKAKYLIFQTGNTWPSENLFKNTEAPEYLVDILEKAGWQVDALGVFSRLPLLEISSYSKCELGAIPRIWCQRNNTTNLVDYFFNNEVVASFPTGLAQRPILFCKS